MITLYSQMLGSRQFAETYFSKTSVASKKGWNPCFKVMTTSYTARNRTTSRIIADCGLRRSSRMPNDDNNFNKFNSQLPTRGSVTTKRGCVKYVFSSKNYRSNWGWDICWQTADASAGTVEAALRDRTLRCEGKRLKNNGFVAWSTQHPQLKATLKRLVDWRARTMWEDRRWSRGRIAPPKGCLVNWAQWERQARGPPWASIAGSCCASSTNEDLSTWAIISATCASGRTQLEQRCTTNSSARLQRFHQYIPPKKTPKWLFSYFWQN